MAGFSGSTGVPQKQMTDAIAQSTAKLEGLTVYNMVQVDSTESLKPWLVIKRLIESMPTGILIGEIQSGMMFNYFGHKYSDNYATFIIDVYSQNAVIPYKVVNNNGSWSYTSISVGNYTSF